LFSLHSIPLYNNTNNSVRSAFIIGISFVTFLSWWRNTAISYFPETDIGNDRFEYFRQIVRIEKLDSVVASYTKDLSHVGVALFTFLYVDFLDTSGTLMGLVSSMGYVDEHGNFPRARMAFSVDAIATMFGSLLGLSPVTSYIESGAGVEAGSRTGLTAVFCGFFFFLSIFFAPIIASIPPWATGGALIVVGSLMAKSLSKIKWHDPAHAATAFLTVMIMPLTYSIAYGLVAGIGCWVIMQSVFRLLELVGIKRPVHEDDEFGASKHVSESSDNSVGKQDTGDGDNEVQDVVQADERA
jgi:adenine/guanine/hypoxanthine permease